MASVAHIAVGMAAARFVDRRGDLRTLALRMATLSAIALLPDIDVVGYYLGIPYGASFGHRGATHSIVFAVAVGLLAGLWTMWRRRVFAVAVRVAFVVALVGLTHAPLDAMTDGGRGVALFWPWSKTRIFFPWRPIRVAPIGHHIFSRRGWDMAYSEILVFSPLVLYAVFPRFRRVKTRRPRGETGAPR